jgi:RNA polymerase sigma-70 factor (ECF subfamily)
MDPAMVVTLDPSESPALAAEPCRTPPFAAVYAQYFRALWRTLRRLGVEKAQLDDAAQDVFVVVHKKLGEFDGRSLRGWLYAIAVRVASDYRRSARHRLTLPLAENIVDEAPGPERVSELTESVELLHALLATLDESKRTVFVLGELEELSAPEISEALALNLNTVYSRLRAARSEFDQALLRHRAQHARRRR